VNEVIVIQHKDKGFFNPVQFVDQVAGYYRHRGRSAALSIVWVWGQAVGKRIRTVARK